MMKVLPNRKLRVNNVGTHGPCVRQLKSPGNALVFFNCIKLALNSGVSKLIGNNRQQYANNK